MYKRFSENETRLHQLRQRVVASYVTISAMIRMHDNINKGCSFRKGEFDHLGELLKVGHAKKELDCLVALIKNRCAGVDFDPLGPLLKICRARDEFHIDWINRLLGLHAEFGEMLAAEIYLKMKRDNE